MKTSFHLILNNIKRIVNNIPEVYLTLRINYTKENLSYNLHEELDEVLHPNVRHAGSFQFAWDLVQHQEKVILMTHALNAIFKIKNRLLRTTLLTIVN